MAVSGITGSNSILLAALRSREEALLRRASSQTVGLNTTPVTNATITAPVLTGTPLTITTPAVQTVQAAPQNQNIEQPVIPQQATLTPQLVSVAAPAPIAAPVTNATITAPAFTSTPLTITTPAVQAVQAAPQNQNIVQPAIPQAVVNPQLVNAAAVGPATALVTNPTITAPAPIAAPVTTTTTAAPAAQAPATAPEGIQQNAQLINEILQNLGFTGTAPSNTLLSITPSPFLTVLQATQELNPLLQNVLLTNENLLNLNFVSPVQVNALLINELPPSLAAAGITQNLDLLQQNVLQANVTLQNLSAEAPVVPTPQPQTQAGQAGPSLTAAATQNINIAIPATGTTATPTTEVTEPATITVAAAPAAATAITTPPPSAAATEVTIPVTATFLPDGFTPDTFPLSLYPWRSPYALAVYLPNNPNPAPGSPKPTTKEVPPPTPAARINPVGNARYRQALLRREGGGQSGSVEYNIPQTTTGQAEKSIRYTLGQVNADIASHGLPLHLVFARHDNVLALDVYDCSYNDACRLSYDVPIQLDHLPDVLGNLQHESGVIVDKKS